MSFKRLKKANENIKEGLLLIDELDATLHPAAQKRLVDLLYRESKNIGIQTIVTTHSSDLLKHICLKTKKNTKKKSNNIEMFYFTNKNRKLDIGRNLQYTVIKSDLLIENTLDGDKIKVYSEDEENRCFLKNLIREYVGYIDLLDVNVGCSSLLSMYSADVNYFGNTLIVFDGDVEDSDIEKIPDVKRLKNIIKLPGEKRPEEVIYEYLLGLNSEHPFWERADTLLISWQYIKDKGPNSQEYKKYEKERDKYKNWFKNNIKWIDSSKLFEFWYNDNEEIAKKFLDEFIFAYNLVAERNFYYKIM